MTKQAFFKALKKKDLKNLNKVLDICRNYGVGIYVTGGYVTNPNKEVHDDIDLLICVESNKLKYDLLIDMEYQGFEVCEDKNVYDESEIRTEKYFCNYNGTLFHILIPITGFNKIVKVEL